MLKPLTRHRNLHVGKQVQIRVAAGYTQDCKIVEIYATKSDRVRVCVVTSKGIKIDTDSDSIIAGCDCCIQDLMRHGCKCNGI